MRTGNGLIEETRTVELGFLMGGGIRSVPAFCSVEALFCLHLGAVRICATLTLSEELLRLRTSLRG